MPAYAEGNRDTITNPPVVVEVLPESTGGGTRPGSVRLEGLDTTLGAGRICRKVVTGERRAECDTMLRKRNSSMTLRIKAAELLLGLLLPPGIAQALDPKSPAAQYSHTLWQTVDGLPDNSIQTTLQTRDGYLWIGTLEGLVRFDGMQFTTFETQNTRALKHNSVVALCEDRRGALWIGTSGGGIAIYEGGAFKATYHDGEWPAQ